MDELLKQHFTWDKFLDERYHCNYCSYDTQLANAAKRHYAKKHDGQEVVDEPEPEQEPNQDQEPEPGQVQDQEPEWQPADPQPGASVENLDTEEQ